MPGFQTTRPLVALLPRHKTSSAYVRKAITKFREWFDIQYDKNIDGPQPVAILKSL